MQDQGYIVREPLLDPKLQVLGYALSWQGKTSSASLSNADLLLLFAFASKHLNSPESGWMLGGSALFLEARPQLLANPFMRQLPPGKIVLILEWADIAGPEALEAVKTARQQGFGIMLRNPDPLAPDADLLSLVSHIEVRCGEADVDKLAKTYAALKHSPSVRMVARPVRSWQEFDVCSSLGMDAFADNLYLTARETPGAAKGINPSQALILQLMDLTRKNADVRELESLLKRDATLSYRLLRYINSVGFGLAVEVTSLRHAVGIIGYTPLYRWLSLLLATASSGDNAAVLMQAAVIRGRFAELLGQKHLPKSESENLFVTGMFSLLDRMLGIPLGDALKQIHLPEAVTEALLTRKGMYGPFLALTESCEAKDGRASDLADALLMSSQSVNQAHLAAIAWAQNFTA